MRNIDAFLECIINKPHRVCGLKLQPFSLFHLSLLSFDIVRPVDLLKAAKILSSKRPSDLSRWKFSYILSFQNELNKLEAYFSDYVVLPLTYSTESSSENPAFFLLQAIIEKTGWSFDYVFYELPVGVAVWLLQSSDSIVSDKEREIIEMLKNKR